MKRLGLKLACLVASIVIWIQVASTTTTEATLQLPLAVINLAPGATVAGSELPATVGVRLKGSKLRLLSHTFLNRAAGRVMVDVGRYRAGETTSHPVAPADVRTELQVVAVLPPGRLDLRIDRQISQRVPVRVPVTGSPPEDRQLLAPVRAEPDSVLVSGPERLVAALDSLVVAAVDLSGVGASVRLQRAIPSPSPYLDVAPREIAVVIAMARVEERTLANVPVVPLVDADQAEVAVSPPVADLMVRGPADSVRALVPARLGVTVPVGGLGEGIHHLRGQVSHPAWLTLVAVEPEIFMVVVGAPESAAEGGGGP